MIDMTGLTNAGLPLIGAAAFLFPLAGLLLGVIVGSFIGTILVRWPQGRSVVAGRSACDGCGSTLRAAELVPVLSYALAGGACRRCGASIDRRHLGMELAGGLIGALALALQPGMMGLATALLGWWLLLLAMLDAEHHWLPDRLTLPLIPLGLATAWLGVGPPLPERLIGAVAGFLLLWAVASGYRRLRGREGLGGGDPKLFAAIGAWIGWQQLPMVLLLAGLIGLLAALILAMRGGRVTMTSRLPLGTLLAGPAWLSWVLLAITR